MYALSTLFILLSFTFYTTVLSHNMADSTKSNNDEVCGASHGRRIRRHDRELFPRRPPAGNKYGHALQFETGTVIRYLKLLSPSKKFSVDFWMKPDGGQHNPSIVLHAYDECAPENEARGWFIGLREAAVTSDLRITFTVHTASAHSNKTIMSHKKVEAGRWLHVAATYDGLRMKLYVNQAKVAVGYGQKGVIFDSFTQGHACDQLEIGGDIKRGLYYRGQIDKLRLWSDAISHRDLTQSLPENTVDNLVQKVFMYEDFDENNVRKAKWVPVTDQYPTYVLSTVPEDQHDLSIRKPPCGKTICDNPEVIKSYVKHTELRGKKQLRVRFVNVMNDDGSSPIITDKEINSQFQLLQNSFSQHNISWELEKKAVKNSSLRSKMVLHVDCEVKMIGDSICNEKCVSEVTGWDGGDCKRLTECPPGKLGDGVCNHECNNHRYDYDGGDCCKTSSRCVDPKSPNRGYLSVDDFKKAVALDNRDALNVYVVNWTTNDDSKLQGTATFPWQKTVHTELGGVVIPPRNFGTTKVLIHEIGHVLGLWHVHHGSESEMDCSSDCIESFPSLELGDLCSDTNPAILNTKCADPDVTRSTSTCGLLEYKNTPYDNFMSYANDSCTDHFTLQQEARMHCYIDLDYQSWQTKALPSFVPLPPRIISAEKDRIKLSWLPPLGPGGDNAKNLCNECDDQHVLEQYATTAYSPFQDKPNGWHAAHQATGHPDTDYCNHGCTPLSWKPGKNCPLYDDGKNCPLYIDVDFKQAVVPMELTIWVPYNAKNALTNIMLIYVDGSTESAGNGTAQCDSPFMKPLHRIKKKVSKVRIYVSNPDVCIDAVKLTSGIGHPNCSKCKPLRYVIRREPPFKNGNELTVATARFEDRNIETKGRYEYRVRAVTHDEISGPFSPPLIYEPKRGFCGDGKIDKGEDCDDGNVRDGDGCNIQCKTEDVFHCVGRPSLCYKHDGDGICEEFEKKLSKHTSIKDCGFYTPEGSRDQWVHRAISNPKYNYKCSADDIIGPPRAELKCENDDLQACFTCGDGWCPYIDDFLEVQDHWLKVYFKTPAIASAIVIHLTNVEHPPSLIKFELWGSGLNEMTALEYKPKNLCKNPITIPIQHDMTKPFFKTSYIKMMYGPEVKVAALALRSWKHFDPVELQGCTGTQLFHPGSQKCHNYECKMPKCSKLMLKHATQIKKCKKGSAEGDACIVQCSKGFTPVAPFEVMCLDGEWKADGEVPHCTPVDCGNPRVENADIVCREGTTYGKKCQYKCKEGTKQTGSDLSLTCEADGLWSATNTFCRQTCPPPPSPPNSRLLLTSKNCNKGKPFDAGESCKYRCKLGYRPSGVYQKALYKKGYFVQRCLKGGIWSSKRCVPIRCPIPDPKIFRWYNCTDSNKFGSVCRLACSGEKVREVKCSAEGKWDEKFQFCSSKGSCSPPINTNSDLTVSCGQRLKHGDECKLSCGKGFIPVKKGDVLRKHLKSTTCSPFLKWYPALSEIRCAADCIDEAIGDGECDGDNNNADCRFDGGDCCEPYIEKNKKSCGNNCECRDPLSPNYGTMEQSGDDRSSS